jgi:hypothetical protein
MPIPTSTTLIARKQIVRRKRAAELRGESEDAVARHLKGKEIQLGPRAIGYRLEDVLQLPPEVTAAPAE